MCFGKQERAAINHRAPQACVMCLARPLLMQTECHRKAEELVHEEESKAAGIQLLKRFSGGGTVVVDENTVFATLIMEQSAFPEVECYPRAIMGWSKDFYNPVFLPYGDFSLQEHGKCLRFCDL